MMTMTGRVDGRCARSCGQLWTHRPCSLAPAGGGKLTRRERPVCCWRPPQHQARRLPGPGEVEAPEQPPCPHVKRTGSGKKYKACLQACHGREGIIGLRSRPVGPEGQTSQLHLEAGHTQVLPSLTPALPPVIGAQPPAQAWLPFSSCTTLACH